MSREDASPYFDGRIATALLVGPLVPLMLYTHAHPLLLPTVIAATVTQLALTFIRGQSRSRTALMVAVFCINGLGWPLYLVQGIGNA